MHNCRLRLRARMTSREREAASGNRRIIMAKGAGKARKKIPKALAVVNADNCTGCEACVEVCPVDCIYKVPGEDLPSLQSFVDIDLERCIGCDLCERWCPWDAIDMIVPTEIADAVARKGGPPEYVEKHWDKLVAVAQAIQDDAVAQKAEKAEKAPAKKYCPFLHG